MLRAPATVSLRDFHADNIIWLPERTNARKPGLLDYQDAFLTHPAYDLMSLLTDARTDVAPSLRREMIAVYAYRTGDSVEALTEAFSAFGAQRNLRILGIFARAARRDGKTQHLKALPRVYGYLSECCSHPSLAPFRRGSHRRAASARRPDARKPGPMMPTDITLMIFAAGFGTRMGDLTHDTPKPMLPLRGKPMIDHSLDLAKTLE